MASRAIRTMNTEAPQVVTRASSNGSAISARTDAEIEDPLRDSTQVAEAGKLSVTPQHAQIVIDGVSIDSITETAAIDHVFFMVSQGIGGLLVTPNMSLLRVSRRDGLRHILADGDLVVCDGTPLTWLARLQGDRFPERVTGASLIWSLSREAAVRGKSVYILGGVPGAADDAARELTKRCPGLIVAGTSCPPHGFEKDAGQLEAIRQQILLAKPDIVFVGLGFPKQEKVSALLREQSSSSWFIACGAAVNFAGKKQDRAPEWMQKLGLEWVHRLASEPRRLGPRYLSDALYGCALAFRTLRAGITDGASPDKHRSAHS